MPESRRETREVPFGPLALLAAAFAVLLSATMLGLHLFLGGLLDGRPFLPAPRERVAPHPPIPLSPLPDLAALRLKEDETLNGYAWIDRKKGTIRLPIDRAMDLLAQEGL